MKREVSCNRGTKWRSKMKIKVHIDSYYGRTILSLNSFFGRKKAEAVATTGGILRFFKENQTCAKEYFLYCLNEELKEQEEAEGKATKRKREIIKLIDLLKSEKMRR